MTNTEADWVDVRYEDVSKKAASKKSGVTVRFMTSPLDVPDMWRHSVQSAPDGGDEFVCEFKYLASKEPLRSFEKDGVKLHVGKNSRRVYRISIPLQNSHQSGGEMEVKIELAIEEIQSLRKDVDLRPTHWDVIKNMLKRPNLQAVQ